MFPLYPSSGPSLRRSLAAVLLALAAPSALVLAVVVGDEDEVRPGIESPATDSAAADSDSSLSITESETPADEPKAMAAGPADSDAPDDSAAGETSSADDAGKAAEPAAATDDTEEPGPSASKDGASKEGAEKPAPAPRNKAVSKHSAAPADGKYSLAYKFKEGEVIRWEVVHRAVVDTTIQGTNQTAETRSTSIKVWQVTGVSPEGNATLVHSVESIDMWQKTQGRQEVRYNSLTDENVPAGYEEIAKAVGVPLTVVKLDPHGGVIEREEKHKQSNASNIPLAIPLPEEPVKVGYTWNVPADVEVILHGGATRKIQTRQKFTLEKVLGGVATIAVETQVLTPLNDPAVEAQLVQRFTNGALRFDLESGREISQQLDLDRRIVGFSGASSSMHYLTRFTEDLLADDGPVAYKKPAPKRAPAASETTATRPPAPATTKGTKPRAKPVQR